MGRDRDHGRLGLVTFPTEKNGRLYILQARLKRLLSVISSPRTLEGTPNRASKEDPAVASMTDSPKHEGYIPVTGVEMARLLLPESVQSLNQEAFHLFRRGNVGSCRAWRNDSEVRVPDSLEASRLLLEGWSIQFENANEISTPFWQVAERISDAFSNPVMINIYISPPNGEHAVGLHSDPSSAMVVQLSGSKLWRFGSREPTCSWFADPASHFREEPDSYAPREQAVGPPLRVTAGDAMVVLRGYPHIAEAIGDGLSVHMTARVLAPTYADIARFLISEIGTRDAGWSREADLPTDENSLLEVALGLERLVVSLRSLKPGEREEKFWSYWWSSHIGGQGFAPVLDKALEPSDVVRLQGLARRQNGTGMIVAPGMRRDLSDAERAVINFLQAHHGCATVADVAEEGGCSTGALRSLIASSLVVVQW